MAFKVEIDALMEQLATRHGKRRGLSPAEQIARWIRIGRAIENRKDFDYRRIEEALTGKRSQKDLTGVEQDVWIAGVADAMKEPTPKEIAFFEERRQRGVGVGMNENGDIVRQLPGGKEEVIRKAASTKDSGGRRVSDKGKPQHKDGKSRPQSEPSDLAA